MSKTNKNKWDPSDPANHRVRNGGGPGAALNSPCTFPGLHEDSPLEAPTSGFSRDAKLMSPDTRELILHSRKTEIDKFAEDRGLDPTIVMGIAEVAMRMGRVPDMRQYGVSGDDAKAIKQFVAGEILNIAIEDLPAMRDKLVAETTTSGNAGAAMRLPTAFLERPVLVDGAALERSLKTQHESNPALELGTGVSNKPALTIADIAQLAADDAFRLRQAADLGVKPAQEQTPSEQGLVEFTPEEHLKAAKAAQKTLGPFKHDKEAAKIGRTAFGIGHPAPSPVTNPTHHEAESVPKPKGDKIGRALKGLGGKLRSPAEVEPGQFNSANGGTAPDEKMDITVKEGVSLPSARMLREARVGAAALREPSAQVEGQSEGMPLDEAKEWIAAMHTKKGALHKQLGVPEDKKIPAGKLAAAAKHGGKEGKRARLAQVLKGLHHK